VKFAKSVLGGPDICIAYLDDDAYLPPNHSIIMYYRLY